MMKILVFGNPAVAVDSLPLRLLPTLAREFPQIEFREFDAVEDLEREGRELIILDSVRGIEEVEVFDGVESFEDSPRFSMHDFDLPVYLKLLKKMGFVQKATIIGVPIGMRKGKALDGVGKAIRKMVRDG
jgi:hypothetical protein